MGSQRVLWFCGWAAVSLLALPASAQAASSSSSGQPSMGSFQPPINFIDNDVNYVFGTGVAAFAGPVSVFGGVAGIGWRLSKGPHPRLGFEAALAAMQGGGALTAAGMPVTAAGNINLHMTVAVASFTLKARLLTPHAGGGIFGLTLYGGPTLGFFQTGLTNDHGTAYRHYGLAGIMAGALLQIVPIRYLELMGFGGGRAIGVLGIPETGDPPSQVAGSSLVTPEFGGNIIAHLPWAIDISLGSVFNFLKPKSKQQNTAKIFTLGVSWHSNSGFAPIADGPVP